MCRVLSYLGLPLLLEDLLYKPDNSFIKQSYHPSFMSHLLNLAGFGMAAWQASSPKSKIPFFYKTDQLPFYDENLRNLTQKIYSSCLLAHIRGVSYMDRKIVSKQNAHPFMFEPSNIAFAHNGALYHFEKMKYDLLAYISEHNRSKIQGTTDSEWFYAVFLTQYQQLKSGSDSKDIVEAILKTLAIFRDLRYKHNIRVNSPINIFISNGEFIAATRYVFDFGWHPLEIEKMDLAHSSFHSLWYTFGEEYEVINKEYKMKTGPKRNSIIIASEPLTEDTTTWIEVPEYSLLFAHKQDSEIEILSYDIDV